MAEPTALLTTLPAFAPALAGFRAEEFLALTETLLAFPIEQDQSRLDLAPFRLARPEPRPEPPLLPLPPRWYPHPAEAVLEAARAWMAPPPRPSIFEGRTGELTRVLRPLLSGTPVRIAGEAGVGKSTLLAAVAAHERTRQRFRRIWWFDQPERIDQTLALALNLPHVLADPDPLARRIRLARQLDDHTLLIVDNLVEGDPQVDTLSTLSAHLLLAVETAPAALDPDNPPPADPEGLITLRGLDDTAAADALALHAGIDDTRRIRGPLLTLATALGYHPYALMLAGALVRRDGLTLDDVQAAVALDAPLADEDDSPGEAQLAARHATLNRALDVSLEALPRDYRRLYEVFGAFPAVGAPFDGLHTVARLGSPLSTRRGLQMLEQYGFIRRDHRYADQYVMHPVAYAHTARSLADEDDSQPGAKGSAGDTKKMLAWALRTVRAHHDDPLRLYYAEPALLHAYARAHNSPADPLCEALRPYLREYGIGFQDAGEIDPSDLGGPRAEAARLTADGLQLTDEGAVYAAEGALNKALELRTAHDSPHAVAETLVALARLYDATGRTEEAAEKLIKAAELVYALGADPSLSVVRRALARVYRHLGRLGGALEVLDDAPEAHFERALILRAQGNYSAAVQEMSLSDEDAPYIRAETFLLAGRFAEALEAITGQDDSDSAQLRAQVYHLQGQTADAIEGYQAALSVSAGDDQARAKTLRALGAALASDRQFAPAREALDAALAIYRAADTADPLRLGRTQRLLAAVHLASGDDAAATAAARDALAQLKKVTAPDDTADAYRTLARALWRSGDQDGALAAFEGEVEHAQSAPERDDQRIGIALHHVGDAYRATGNLDRAVANYRRALTHLSPTADPNAFLITQLALHRTLLEAGRLPAANDAAQEALDHLNRQPVPDLAQIGVVQAVRARTQQAMERPIRARQSLDEWAKTLAARAADALADPRPALPVLALGLAVRSLLVEDRPALALEIAGPSSATADAHFPGSPASWAALRDLGETYLALDRAEEAILMLDPLLGASVRDHPGQAATYALAHALTGQGYRRLGDPGAALDHLRAALAHEPDDHLKALLHETIAAIQLETGEPAAAVDSLRTALPLVRREDHPDVAARLLTTTAHTLGGLNRYAEAIGVYEEALAALRDVEGVSPTHTADVLRSLGQTHEIQGQLPEAARAYRRALNVLERADAPRQSREILHLLARVTAALGDQSAVQLYDLLREQTEAWGNTQELGQVLRELADVHRDGGRLTLAVQHYQAALGHQPAQLLARDRSQTLRSLGRAYAQMERYDDARAAWTEALELARDLPDQSPQEIALTHHAIAEAFRNQGLYDDAERSFHEALSFHPAGTVASAATLRALGQALHAAGRPVDALEPLRKALDTEKTQPQQANARIVQTLYLLATAHEDMGDQNTAIARYHEALVYLDRRLQPVAYADTLRILGGLYGEIENWHEAHTAFQTALDIESHHVPRSDDRISATLQAIADTYRSQGDLEKAAEFYQKVTVYSNLARRASEDLRQTLDELERRRATLQAAQQSLALLDRNENTSLKDRALVHALIARAHAALNQPQESSDAIRALLAVLASRQPELRTDGTPGDLQALAWLFAAHQAQQDEDPVSARMACASALSAASNADLRWVIGQVAQTLA